MNKKKNTTTYPDATGSWPATDDRMTMMLSLEILNGLGKAGLVAVPLEPSPGMLKAGARTGTVDAITAAAIYRAMLAADE